MNHATLGDVGPHDDASYSGDYTPGNPLTMDYFREKARQFQAILNSLDAAYQSVVALITTPSVQLDDETRGYLFTWIDDFESHKSQLVHTAEAANAGAAIVNSMGGRMPQLSIPGTLGLAPIAIPAVAVAWIAAAAVLTVWGLEMLRGLNERLGRQQLLDAQATPEGKADLARELQRMDEARRAVESSPWGALAGSVKWLAIAALGFIGWRALQGTRLLK